LAREFGPTVEASDASEFEIAIRFVWLVRRQLDGPHSAGHDN